jgi:hypothetical protein
MTHDGPESTRVIRAALLKVDRTWFLETHDGVRSAVSPFDCDRYALIGVDAEWELHSQRRADPRAIPADTDLRLHRANGPKSSTTTKHDSEDFTKPRRRVVKIDATGQPTEKLIVCFECLKPLPRASFPNPSVRRCGPCGGSQPPMSIRTTSAGLPGLGKRR